MRRILSVLLLVVIFSSFALSLKGQFYNGTQMTFGKNRVQYNDFFWTFYRFKNFDTYFYQGGKELAEFTGRNADKEIEDIEKLLDYNTQGRLQFIIFNKLSELKQSNIGLESNEVMSNTGGITRIIGNKILIYWDGDHEHFRQQIRAGVTKVLLDQLLYGGTVKERLQSSILLNIPDWYIYGLVSYMSRGWTVDDENRMRDAVSINRFKKFSTLVYADQLFAGHAMWYYIDVTYGPASISNMVYMTRINRGIENGFNYVLGASQTKVTQAAVEYFQKLYLNGDAGKSMPGGNAVKIKTKKNALITQFKVSPDGNQVAYVTNELGKYKIRIKDLKTGKTSKVLKAGYKSLSQKTDETFPLLAWQPSGRAVAYITERKGFLWLSTYNVKSHKTESNKLMYFEKVHDFSYSDDGQNLVMSATQKGQSDIFVWNVRARQSNQITKDKYDDLQPRFTNNSSKIIFVSNRSNDTLVYDTKDYFPLSKKDVFLYDYASRSNILARITNTSNADEMQPMEADSGRYIYLSELNGLRNRYAATVDSTIAFVDTTEHYRFIIRNFSQSNYMRNVDKHDVSFRKDKYGELMLYKGKYQLFVNPIPASEVTSSNEIIEQGTQANKSKEKPKQTTKAFLTDVDETQNADTVKQNYTFQSTLKSRKQIVTVTTDSIGTVSNAIPNQIVAAVDTGYRLPKQRNYDLAFSPDYVVTQLDNSLLNATYQAYTGSGVYYDPGLTGLFKVGISDLMNDVRMVGGVRLSGDLNSNEYYIRFEMMKKRLDHQVTFYRQAREDYSVYSLVKVTTHEIKYITKLPFNDLKSLRFSGSFRNDRGVVLSTDYQRLLQPNVYEYWGSLKAEYVFDNTISTGLNLYNGTRYKIFAETFKQIDKPNSFLNVIGVDFRTYVKVHRQIVWANRFAASTSFGDLKLIYYLGSVDNAIAPSDNFNYLMRVDQSQNYAFQALASNMRGFRQNVRNGNSFALINSELRIPVFQYLINRPIKSDFIRNFQVVGFFDAGSAWTGATPYAKDNNLNLDIIQSGPLTITVNKKMEPLVFGTGFGLRSRLLGYFLRADWGWGYNDGYFTPKSLFNFSLSLDF